MRSFIAYIEIDQLEREVLVQFDYQPAEAQTLTYPGCDAEVEITRIREVLDSLGDRRSLIGESDLIESLSPHQLDELEQKALDSMADLDIRI